MYTCINEIGLQATKIVFTWKHCYIQKHASCFALAKIFLLKSLNCLHCFQMNNYQYPHPRVCARPFRTGKQSNQNMNTKLSGFEDNDDSSSKTNCCFFHEYDFDLNNIYQLIYENDLLSFLCLDTCLIYCIF
jgi:hypothetical protein